MDLQHQEIGKPDDAAGSTRKILVKIRHSKPTSEMAPSPEITPSPEIVLAEENRTHDCKECNKSFSSGKALGGHMSSAHVQANKDYSYKKLLKSNRDSGLHACGVCGKSFPSQKSLYGHMRCHPDRDWRGMEPPSSAGQRDDSSEASTEYCSDEGSEDEGAGSFVSSLKAWPVKAIRGRSAVTKSPEGSSSDEEISAGHQLLRLLKRLPDSDEKEVGVSVPLACQGPALEGSCMLESTGSFSLKNNTRVGQGDDEVNIKKRKRETEANHEPDQEIQGRDFKRQRASNNRPPEMKIGNTEDDGKGELESEADLLLGAICVLANGKRDHTTGTCLPRPVVKSDHASSSPEKHICSLCKKVFPSHQALGGHKSSHNKFKMSIINTEDSAKNNITHNNIIIGTSNNSSVGGMKNVMKSDQQQPDNDNSHICPICKRVFPTGRALGGHKKIHNNKGGNINAGDDHVGDDGSKGGEEKVVSVRDFDLNMVPHDENVAAGDGDGDDAGLLSR